ncbi:hypothetical protein EBS40_07205 [bacterium]|nr:hypothetical protein [bacterium]
MEAVASANHEVFQKQGRSDRNATDPAQNAEIKGEQNTKTPKQTKAKSEDTSEEDDSDNAEGLDTQDFSHQIVPSTTQVEKPETGEPSQTETQTEAENPSDYDWMAELPQAPETVEIKPPQPDEYGQIDPVAYADYVEARVDQKNKLDSYNKEVITKSFEAVEKILPEVKNDPSLQTAIRSVYLANRNPVEVVDLARSFRKAFDANRQTGKTEGIKSAKASITVQKNAAVETKSPTQKTQSSSPKNDNLTKRLARGDTSAFEELMNDWQENQKI